MKRSSMLYKIVDVLNNTRENPNVSVDEMANTILTFLEGQGMLPPVHLKESVLPGISDFLVNEWEDEST